MAKKKKKKVAFKVTVKLLRFSEIEQDNLKRGTALNEDCPQTEANGSKYIFIR